MAGFVILIGMIVVCFLIVIYFLLDAIKVGVERIGIDLRLIREEIIKIKKKLEQK